MQTNDYLFLSPVQTMSALATSNKSTHDLKTVDKTILTPTIPSSPKGLSSHSYLSKRFHEFLIKILRHGPIPQHIGFIMDGNRRFARKINVQTTEGHYMGFIKMEEVLDICLQFGIKTVTVYAFSIENFKRPKEEVDALMQLAKAKLIELCQSPMVKKYGICVRILGNMSYLPQDLREVVEEAVEMTKDNNRSILNVCLSYTSRDEITNSVKTVVKMVENKQIQIGDIDENLIEQCLFTHGCPPLEILIRTSGEIRLSDFLLWQCHQDCYIHFENCYWPEFSIWKMLQIILEYQLAYETIKEKRKKSQKTLLNLYKSA